MIPYITKTKDHSRRLMLPVLKEVTRKLGIDAKYNESLLRCTLANGSVIWLTGADKLDDIEKLRGDKYPLVLIDECGAMNRFLRYLVDDVLKFASYDYDGSIVMTGTPPAACSGYFHECCLDDKWSTHHWTMLDNPMFPVWRGKADWKAFSKEWFEKVKAQEGWSDDNPVFLREMLGQWIRDDSSMVYQYNASRNSYNGELPPGIRWQYVIGLDLGYSALTAWTVWAYENSSTANMFQVDEFGEFKLMPHQIAEKTSKLLERYPGAQVVADPGALGVSIIAEMQKRYQLPVVPAQKQQKHEYIELFNSDMHEGRIKALADSRLVDEWLQHQWEDDFDAAGRQDKKRKEASTPNHYSDSALYAWRKAYHWSHRKGPAIPAKGTPEYENYRMQQLMEEQAQMMQEDSSIQFGRSRR